MKLKRGLRRGRKAGIKQKVLKATYIRNLRIGLARKKNDRSVLD
jgi:hypothetical protein